MRVVAAIADACDALRRSPFASKTCSKNKKPNKTSKQRNPTPQKRKEGGVRQHAVLFTV
jgi:hypothetical protein